MTEDERAELDELQDDGNGAAPDGTEPDTHGSDVKVITLDKRVVVGLLALVGVVIVGAIWLVVDRQRDEAATPQEALTYTGRVGTATEVPTPVGASGQSPAGGIDLNLVPTSEYDQQPVIRQVVRGSAPVSLADVPVGAGEPRIALADLDATDYVDVWGAVPNDSPTMREYVLRNEGSGPLRIDKVGGSCGCTGAVVENPVIGPGEETRMRITYEPRAANDFGKDVKKQVYVMSNDPVTPVMEFFFTVSVPGKEGSGDEG